MRPGEITALQVADFRDGMIHVERRVYRGKVDTPKSWRSRRAIPATKSTESLIGQWIELLQHRAADAWLFPSENLDTPASYTKVYQKHIRPALKTVGLERATFQVLRRTWVTELSETEKDPGVRAQLAGHSTDVNENVYRQPRVETLKRSMKKFEKRLQ
jgi:integrase